MSDKIQIYHFIPGFKFGGIESRTMDLYSYVDKDKYQYNIVTFAAKEQLAGSEFFEEISKNGGNVVRVAPITAKTLFRHISDIKALYKNHKVDVAHCYSPQSGLAFLYYAKKAGVKCRILHARTSSFDGGSNAFIKEIVKKLEVKCANVKLAVSKLSGEWLFGKNDFTVIPNAIHLEKYAFSPEARERLRREYGLDGSTVIGHVGRSTYAKNHRYLFEVFAELLKKGLDVKMLLVGPEKDDPAVTALCEEFGFPDGKVVICGYQKDPSPFYCAMDFLVFPSHYEGLPGTLIEAQASGLVCFASDAITDEVKLTDNLNFLSIKEPPQVWADAVEKSIGYTREDRRSEIENTGYSLKRASEMIMSIYDTSK